MQIQQNLFSIYRLILKLPYFVLVGLTIAFTIMAVGQVMHITATPNSYDFSKCMVEYVQLNNPIQNITKNQSNINTNNTASNNNTVIENTTLPANQTVIHNTSIQPQIRTVPLIQQNRILHIRTSDIPTCTVSLNYTYTYGQDDLPLAFVVSNNHLSFLDKRSKEYLNKHNITYDLITIPNIDIKESIFGFFRMYQYEINQFLVASMMEAIMQSSHQFATNLTKYLQQKLKSNTTNNNQTNATHLILRSSQLFLLYFYPDPPQTIQHKINLLSQLTLYAFPSIFLKLFYLIFAYVALYIASMFVGLVVRYVVILVMTIFLVAYHKCMNQRWGWVNQYLKILYNRLQQDMGGTLKMIVLYVLGVIGMNALLVFGLYCVITKLVYPMTMLQPQPYITNFFKIIFLVEIYNFVCARSRTMLRFFPLLSFMVSYSCLIIGLTYKFILGIQLLNLNLTIQLLLFSIFLSLQKHIYQSNQKGLIGQYCPSITKPRMMFYMGYDISWHSSLPPIWTYFTGWFDYSHFNEGEKCLLEKDYQLLYGRMLGLNQRQEIPEEEVEEGVGRGEMPSNQMGLIQQERG